jgi:arylsulfatase A-like enzyme
MVALCALTLAACRGPSGQNVLLITVDTLRPDHLSCYGYAANQTPQIDALAARGVVFDHAFCDVTWTTPSMASVFTGTYAVHHGLRVSSQRLAETQTLAAVLRRHGYTTAAIIGSFPVDSTFGLNQGFELYDEDFNTSILKDDDPAKLAGPLPADANDVARRNWFMLRRLVGAYRPDDQVAARAVRWLRTERREPFFLWVHFFGPHEKMYVHLTLEDLTRRNLQEYDPDVSVADTQVGVVLRALRAGGLEDRTVVVLHADHGQNLFERYYVGHGRDLYEPSLRVPLIIAEPGSGGRRSNAFARNIDIFPTVLDMLGLPLPAGLDGRSLRPAVEHPWLARLRQMKEGETYAETYMSATGLYRERLQFEQRDYAFGFIRRGVRTREWKYVENEPVPLVDDPQPPTLPPELIERTRSGALYDMQRDPLEGTDVSAAHPEEVAAMRAKLHAYMADAHNAPESPLDEASKERLRTLGYAQ